MAGNYAQLLDIINNPTDHSLPAWDNDNKLIEGLTIKQYLLTIISSLTVGYQFMGVATPSTSPGTPDQNVFYIGGAGTYANFGASITVGQGQMCVFAWNGSWTNTPIDFAYLLNRERNCLSINGTYTNNSVQIEKIWLLEPTGGTQNYINVNNTFNFGSLTSASEYLVLKADNTVSIKPFSELLDNDCVLLVWSRSDNDYYGGALFNNYLLHKTLSFEDSLNGVSAQSGYNGKMLDGYFNITTPYEYKSSSIDKGIIIGCSQYQGKKIKVTCGNTSGTIAFLKNSLLTIGSTPNYCDSQNKPIVVSSGNTLYFDIPFDCTYIYTYGATITMEYPARISKTIEVNARIGSVFASNAKPYVGFNASRIAEIPKLMIADEYIKIDSDDIITAVNTLSSDESYKVECFAEDFTFIGQGDAILPNTKYIRIALTNQNNYTHYNKKISVVLSSYTDEKKTVKCGNELESTWNQNVIWFTYPVHNVTYSNDNSESDTYAGDNQNITQNIGYIILPPNYQREGKKSKVAIHCHGTAGIKWRGTSEPFFEYNLDYLRFIAKNGYAVVGCFTTTALYAASYRDADIVTPLAYSAYVEVFRYVMDLFNLDADNVSIFGYSAGGIMANMLGRLQPFKINCVASLAGSLDYVTNGRVVSALDGDANILGNTLNGIPVTNQPEYFSTQGMNKAIDPFMIQRFKDYWVNICGLSPLFFGLTGIEITDLMDEMYSVDNTTSALEGNTNLVALVEQGKIVCNVPIKIWHAINDANVPYAISKFYCQMIHNAGGYAKLRTFPIGTGGHNAVGNSNNTTDVPFMDYVTALGETIHIPVAYGELVDWFNKWAN